MNKKFALLIVFHDITIVSLWKYIFFLLLIKFKYSLLINFVFIETIVCEIFNKNNPIHYLSGIMDTVLNLLMLIY